jgi:hypothetical protein
MSTANATSMNRSCKGIDVWSLPGERGKELEYKETGEQGGQMVNFFFLFFFLHSFLRLPHSLRVTTNALSRFSSGRFQRASWWIRDVQVCETWTSAMKHHLAKGKRSKEKDWGI